jgi:hypothetical protein
MPRWRTLVLVLAVGSGIACYQDDSLPVGLQGRSLARVLLTDAPFPYDSVASVDVFVIRIEASATFDTTGGGDWTLITAPRRRFNLLALQQGTTALLGEGELETGQYQAIRMVINTDSSAIRWANGADAQVNWQNYSGTEELALHALVESPVPVLPATAAQNLGAEIVIDFDVGRSFLFDFFGTREFTFLPWIRAVQTDITGAIAGTVTSTHTGASTPLRNANVTVFRGDSLLPLELRTVAATGRTDATGQYRVAFLRAGTYLVRVEQPEYPFLAPVETPGVVVTAGQVALHSIVLPEAGAGGSYIQVSGPASVGVGGTILLQAAVGDDNGDPVASPSVTWSISDTGIVAVRDSGAAAFVTGKRPGAALVIAASGVLRDTARVEVIGSTAPVATITLSPAARALVASDSLQSYGMFTAVLRDSAGNQLVGRALSWSTSDAAVIEIVTNYEAVAWVRALRAGSAVVRATSEGKTGQASVTVAP